MSMEMDAYLRRRSRLVPFLSGWGHQKGGLGGGVSGGSTPKIGHVVQKNKIDASWETISSQGQASIGTKYADYSLV
jgi:hypothetical protein